MIDMSQGFKFMDTKHRQTRKGYFLIIICEMEVTIRYVIVVGEAPI